METLIGILMVLLPVLAVGGWIFCLIFRPKASLQVSKEVQEIRRKVLRIVRILAIVLTVCAVGLWLWVLCSIGAGEAGKPLPDASTSVSAMIVRLQ